MEVEKASFTPLVFTVAGSCGRECDVLLKRLSAQIAHRSGDNQSAVMAWMRTKLSYTIMRANTISLRGPHVSKGKQRSNSNSMEVDYTIVQSEACLAF